MSLFTDEQLSLLTDAQLLEAAQHLARVYKARRASQDIGALAQFRRDDLVEYVAKGSYRLPKGAIGRIKSLNQRTVTVDFGQYQEWRIAGSALRKAPPEAKVLVKSRALLPLIFRHELAESE